MAKRRPLECGSAQRRSPPPARCTGFAPVIELARSGATLAGAHCRAPTGPRRVMADALTRAKMRFLDLGMHDARATYDERKLRTRTSSYPRLGSILTIGATRI